MAHEHTAIWLAHLKSKALVQGSTGQSKRNVSQSADMV